MAIAETNVYLHQPNSILDTTSLILNHSQSFFTMDMERGPRYQAYAELRETKLRMKYLRQLEYEQEQEPETKLPTPPRKQVKFQAGLVSGRKGSSSLLAQSVPDFSAALRKENRKPSNMLPTVMELTPPSKSFNKGCGVLSSSRGSKSANGVEKRRGGGGGGGVLMARKSYANIDELKSFSSVTANAINGESRGGGRRNSRVVGKRTVLGYRDL